MMAMMNPKLIISSAHPPMPVRAWAGGGIVSGDNEKAIGQDNVWRWGQGD